MLPEITTNGSNTFGYLIDGRTFVGKSSEDLFSKTIGVQGQYSSQSGMNVNGQATGNYENRSVSLDIKSPIKIGTFDIGGKSKSGIYYNYQGADFGIGGDFRTDSIHTGSVTILRFDTINHIYSGTFQGTLYKRRVTLVGVFPDSVKINTLYAVSITNGRFDFREAQH